MTEISNISNLFDTIESVLMDLIDVDGLEIELTNIYYYTEGSTSRRLLQSNDIGFDFILTSDDGLTTEEANTIEDTVTSDTFVDDFNDEFSDDDALTLESTDVDIGMCNNIFFHCSRVGM